MSKRLVLLYLIVGSSLLMSCSAAPAPEPVSQAQAPAPSVFCHDAARAVTFDSLKVPKGEEPIDVAMTNRDIWVLFQPARLLRIRRGSGNVEVATKLGEAGEIWTVLDADPLDESVWVASQHFALHNVSPDMSTRTVRLQRELIGTGGFWRLLASEEALYATPICADGSVWRIDRQGKVLETAFELDEVEMAKLVAEGQIAERPPCFGARIERDVDGRILAWRFDQRKSYQADAQGGWTDADASLFGGVELGVRALADVEGTDGRYAYAKGPSSSLFFWKGRPAFLLPVHQMPGDLNARTVLALPEGGAAREVPEGCHGAFILDVATNATSYAVLTPHGVAFGELEGAPDLP